ncbi:MAG: MFS transporter, partial [Candidatus Thermoplasmatota archaeon]
EPRKKSFVGNELSFKHISNVLMQKSVLLLTIPWFIIYLLVGTIMTFFSKAGHEEFNLEGWKIGLFLSLGCIFVVATQRFYGKLSDRFGRVPLMFLGGVGILGLSITSGILYLTSPSQNPMHIYSNIMKFLPLLAIFALMAGAFAPSALASLADVSHEKRKGITMGVYVVVISSGMLFGPIITGFIADHFGGFGVLVFMAICGITMLFFIFLRYLEMRNYEIHKR